MAQQVIEAGDFVAAGSIDDSIANDPRIQYEFQQLTRLLDEIVDAPVNEAPVVSDPAWPIPENHVSRWTITLQREITLKQVCEFRETLLRCENVLDAQVESMMNDRICIRLVTTGGIQMGPVEQAIKTLRTPIDIADQMNASQVWPLSPA